MERIGTKAARNEGRKLLAGLLNTLAAAAVLLGLFQPMLVVITLSRPFGWRDLIATLVFMSLAAILHLIAQVIVRRLED